MVGRLKEKEIMQELLNSKEAEMLAVIGRRRVGKTFLIRNVYKKELVFEMTGIQFSSTKMQLHNFSRQLKLFSKATQKFQEPNTWFEAFSQLEIVIRQKRQSAKKVIFFDELPWIASQKSNFLQALAHFWNNWAVTQHVIVVICGSAASWMIKNVVNSKGGLHNRITKQINLQAFTLNETERYLQSRKVRLSRYQIAQIYMVMGGIPHYLKEIQKGLSAAQNIDTICFKNNGLLKNEFSNLYAALFKNADNHITIIRALAKKWKGLTRENILKISKLSDGGTFSKALKELEVSGFITSYIPFGKKKKSMLYRLTDEYSLFYLRFIEVKINNSWINLSQTQRWKSWSGYAFETLCLKHSNTIKNALGIEGVYSEESSFFNKTTKEQSGFQIDLLIDRNDNVITICEMKFYASEFTITKSYADNLRNKISRFKALTKTKKQLFFAIISTYGVVENIHKIDVVQNDITLDALFQ